MHNEYILILPHLKPTQSVTERRYRADSIYSLFVDRLCGNKLSLVKREISLLIMRLETGKLMPDNTLYLTF